MFSVWLLPGAVNSVTGDGYSPPCPQRLALRRPSTNVYRLLGSEQLNSRKQFGWNSNRSRLDPKPKSTETRGAEPSASDRRRPRRDRHLSGADPRLGRGPQAGAAGDSTWSACRPSCQATERKAQAGFGVRARGRVIGHSAGDQPRRFEPRSSLGRALHLTRGRAGPGGRPARSPRALPAARPASVSAAPPTPPLPCCSRPGRAAATQPRSPALPPPSLLRRRPRRPGVTNPARSCAARRSQGAGRGPISR